MADKAKQTARGLADRAKSAAGEWGEKAADKARDLGTATDSYVRENTWISLGVVAVVAGVIGFLLGSRQDD